MKRLTNIILCIALLLSLASCDNNENLSEGIVSDDLSSYAVEEDLPEMVIGHTVSWYTKNEKSDYKDFTSRQEMDQVLHSEVEKELIGTTVSGNYFGLEFNNAVYDGSKRMDGYLVHWYFETGVGTLGFLVRDKIPNPTNEMILYYCIFSKSEKLTSEEERINKARELIKLYGNPDFLEYDTVWAFPDILQFQKKINGVVVDVSTVTFMNDEIVSIKLENGVLTETLPEYDADDYVNGAMKKVRDFYEAQAYDYFSDVTLLSAKNSYLKYCLDYQTYAIAQEIEFKVRYKDDTESVVTQIFYFPFDPEDYE